MKSNQEAIRTAHGGFAQKAILLLISIIMKKKMRLIPHWSTGSIVIVWQWEVPAIPFIMSVLEFGSSKPWKSWR